VFYSTVPVLEANTQRACFCCILQMPMPIPNTLNRNSNKLYNKLQTQQIRSFQTHKAPIAQLELGCAW
jgi:hypothetical protein